MFEKNEKLKSIYIDIVDDFEWEPDEFFFVKIHLENEELSNLGNIPICQITIINDDGKINLLYNCILLWYMKQKKEVDHKTYKD